MNKQGSVKTKAIIKKGLRPKKGKSSKKSKKGTKGSKSKQ